jgi:hypothetical protein
MRAGHTALVVAGDVASCGELSRAEKRGRPPCLTALRVVALSCAAARELFHLNNLRPPCIRGHTGGMGEEEMLMPPRPVSLVVAIPCNWPCPIARPRVLCRAQQPAALAACLPDMRRPRARSMQDHPDYEAPRLKTTWMQMLPRLMCGCAILVVIVGAMVSVVWGVVSNAPGDPLHHKGAPGASAAAIKQAALHAAAKPHKPESAAKKGKSPWDYMMGVLNRWHSPHVCVLTRGVRRVRVGCLIQRWSTNACLTSSAWREQRISGQASSLPEQLFIHCFMFIRTTLIYIA